MVGRRRKFGRGVDSFTSPIPKIIGTNLIRGPGLPHHPLRNSSSGTSLTITVLISPLLFDNISSGTWDAGIGGGDLGDRFVT